ncbi:hypothetical protein PsYK624_068100 [Phanerochaete sordida]|uniref:Uncharacterized protein n=1 Tax=Phanerochaete sordida TaxID=48140 RepID=A0A9P3G9B5_9APHY|nr:hypothetical protein PsYK624_068100 [Phanerochaete sordida]
MRDLLDCRPTAGLAAGVAMKMFQDFQWIHFSVSETILSGNEDVTIVTILEPQHSIGRALATMRRFRKACKVIPSRSSMLAVMRDSRRMRRQHCAAARTSSSRLYRDATVYALTGSFCAKQTSAVRAALVARST